MIYFLKGVVNKDHIHRQKQKNSPDWSDPSEPVPHCFVHLQNCSVQSFCPPLHSSTTISMLVKFKSARLMWEILFEKVLQRLTLDEPGDQYVQVVFPFHCVDPLKHLLQVFQRLLPQVYHPLVLQLRHWDQTGLLALYQYYLYYIRDSIIYLCFKSNPLTVFRKDGSKTKPNCCRNQ